MRWPWQSDRDRSDREPAEAVAARLHGVADELERATMELRATVKDLRADHPEEQRA